MPLPWHIDVNDDVLRREGEEEDEDEYSGGEEEELLLLSHGLTEISQTLESILHLLQALQQQAQDYIHTSLGQTSPEEQM